MLGSGGWVQVTGGARARVGQAETVAEHGDRRRYVKPGIGELIDDPARGAGVVGPEIRLEVELRLVGADRCQARARSSSIVAMGPSTSRRRESTSKRRGTTSTHMIR